MRIHGYTRYGSLIDQFKGSFPFKQFKGEGNTIGKAHSDGIKSNIKHKIFVNYMEHRLRADAFEAEEENRLRKEDIVSEIEESTHELLKNFMYLEEDAFNKALEQEVQSDILDTVDTAIQNEIDNSIDEEVNNHTEEELRMLTMLNSNNATEYEEAMTTIRNSNNSNNNEDNNDYEE